MTPTQASSPPGSLLDAVRKRLLDLESGARSCTTLLEAAADDLSVLELARLLLEADALTERLESLRDELAGVADALSAEVT